MGTSWHYVTVDIPQSTNALYLIFPGTNSLQKHSKTLAKWPLQGPKASKFQVCFESMGQFWKVKACVLYSGMQASESYPRPAFLVSSPSDAWGHFSLEAMCLVTQSQSDHWNLGYFCKNVPGVETMGRVGLIKLNPPPSEEQEPLRTATSLPFLALNKACSSLVCATEIDTDPDLL